MGNALVPGRLFPKQVGSDLSGNSYFIKIESKSTRRFVKINNETGGNNPIPVEWQSWLAWRREEPPTLDELTKSQVRLKNLKIKVKELEEADEKLKIQERAHHESGGMGVEELPAPLTLFSQTTRRWGE
eukprot:TRINITY_DN244_c0_g1_i1.p1 TRINITY_DN244_c0_g1~~TRINITY_DN244_c0_g1_i1.p1  ORF type:complete len:129 (-),score=35.50 TRINITY_DN244_c0_g1_i1:178-564(-)